MILESIWFFIWGLLWAVFFMSDGFDLGIGTLFPFLGKTEEDRRIMVNAVGPLWDGNEVWLLTAGGVTFAAFPEVYAVMFSSLYAPLMLILFGLIVRGVSFEFRGKIDTPAWRKIWDTCIFIGSALPALLFGVAFGNIFQGIAFDANGIYQGTLLTLLNPYGLLGGLLFLCLFMVHGALWLSIRAEGVLHDRAAKTAERLWPALLAVAVVFLLYTPFATRLYDNYLAHPALFLVIIFNVAALLGIRIFIARKQYGRAWFSSALTIVLCTFFGVIGLFPALFPSSIDSAYSLTAFNAASSPLTLKIMLAVVILLVPVVIGYQVWAYTLFSGKLSPQNLSEEGMY